MSDTHTAHGDDDRTYSHFLGWAIFVLGLAIAIVVVGYWYDVFWLKHKPDLNWVWGGDKVPPETYPVILLSFWTLSQRMVANWRPEIPAAWWIDFATSLAVAAFLAVTFVYAIATQTNVTFLIVLGAFVIQGIGDTLLNGRRRYYGGTFKAVGGLFPNWLPRGGIHANRDIIINSVPQGSTLRLERTDEGVKASIDPAPAAA